LMAAGDTAFVHKSVRFCRLSIVVFAAVVIPSASGAAPSEEQDVSGVWWAASYSPKISLLGGGDLPYNAAGKAAYAKNIDDLKSGTLTDAARVYCAPDGVPRFLETPYPFEIVQTPGQVTMIYELNHFVRVIAMDRPLPKYEDVVAYPYYSGHSFGHWDGNSLVIETIGFNDKTFLDETGAPHSAEMTTVERLRKIDGGKSLEDVVTMHDPNMFTRDWSARFVYASRSDIQLEDYVCGEKHRDLSQVKGVQGH
jgi:hypothetical protein